MSAAAGHAPAARPKVVLVAWDVFGPEHPAGILAELIERAHERFDVVVVARSVADRVRPLVDWRRAPAPRAPMRLKWATFFLTGAIRLSRARGDLVHAWGPAPLVPVRVDLATPDFCHVAYTEAMMRATRAGRSTRWRLARGLLGAIERWCYSPRRARMLAAQSLLSKRELERSFPGVPVAWTPRGIDTQRFAPDGQARRELRSAEGLGDAATVAVFVGRDWDLKGLGVTLVALAQAAARGNAPTRLWVLGENEWGSGGRERFGALARRLGIEDRVRFLGFRSDIERFYAAADLLVLPSLCEVSCRAAREAAATGLPVIATCVGGIDEVVGDDEAGILVEREPGAVAAALGRLTGSPRLRARMGAAGRRRCLEHTPERMLDSIIDAYDRLLAASRASATSAQ